MLLHIGAFHLDQDSHRRSPWHQLSPQSRVLGVLMWVLAIALTPNGHWLTWSFYGIGILGVVQLSRVTLPVLLQRLAVESVFVSVVVLGNLFRGGGEPLWQWGWLSITTQGLTLLGSVTCKLLLTLTLLNVLTLTTPIPALLQALAVLKMPPLLVAILASMYRYLAVLIDEFTAMRRAALSRNLMASNHWQRLVVGNMIGSLFIRTYERGERVHQAMRSRGYEGMPATSSLPPLQKADWVFLAFTLLFAILGQMAYFPDLLS
ncbi:MAG: cobalt ECF transporter T component CbiQ [Thermosynechococcaceae cyanobacterium]